MIYYVPTLAWPPGSRSEEDTVPGSWKSRWGKGADQGGVGTEGLVRGAGVEGEPDPVGMREFKAGFLRLQYCSWIWTAPKGGCSWQREQHEQRHGKEKEGEGTQWFCHLQWFCGWDPGV